MQLTFLIYGLVFGSFYNVVIYRLPNGKSLIKPPSSCSNCGHRLSPLELIPVISFLMQKGKCKHCGASFSIRYAMVEVLTGVLFLLSYLKFGLEIELFKVLFLGSLCIIISFIDYDLQIIPDSLNLTIIVAGIFYLVIFNPITFANAGLGFLIGGGLLFLIALVGPMGGGDIKYMAATGIWLGFGYTLMTLLLSFMIGGFISLLLLIFKLVDRKTAIPFGPFLCMATLITLFYGNELFLWYLDVIVFK